MYEVFIGFIKCVRGVDDEWIVDLLSSFFIFQKRVGDFGRCYVQFDVDYVFLECFVVFCKFNSFKINVNQVGVVFFLNVLFVSFDGQIKGCLFVYCWEYCINFVFFEYLYDIFNGKW